MQYIKKFSEAFDKRDPDPNKNYGIHGVDLRMVIKGDEGAVQFVLYTSRMLPHVQKDLVERSFPKRYGKEAIEYALAYSGPFTEGKEIQEIIDWHNFIEPKKFKEQVIFRAIPADLGYHSPVPMYDGQEPMGSKNYKFTGEKDEDGIPGMDVTETGTFTPCEFLDGRACYYDGSSLNAEDVYNDMINHGEEAVWERLRKYYIDTFGSLELLHL